MSLDDIRVGQEVRVRFAGRDVRAVVVEDRGGLGIGGRRLLRVQVRDDAWEEPFEFELPAAEVKQAA